MLIQPKPFLDKFKIRNKSYGNERRRNMSKIILEHGTPLPKSVQYKDIDASVMEWVENSLDLSYDGKRLPTFKLFSNQRINEYSQEWEHVDSTGNLVMNFKTLTRENNPKKGENQGENYNIPGDRDYPMFMIPVLQENGEQAYDMYSMKQPFSINLEYSLSIITNKYDLINEMNEKINNEFKAIDCYICPNGHYMPMVLTDISDESEYGVDDRKYYSQTYKITVKGYIIKENDFKVTRLPSRVTVRLIGPKNYKKSSVKIEEEDYIADECCLREEHDPYYNKLITLIINFPKCTNISDFVIDTDIVIRTVETKNVYDFVISVNKVFQDLEEDEKIFNNDNIHLEIEKDDETEESQIIIKGFDPNSILDDRYNPEFTLDEDITEEEITINVEKKDK